MAMFDEVKLSTRLFNICNYILKYFIESNNPVNVLQLNKILFLVQVYSKGKIIKEDFYVNGMGPHIVDVYNHYKTNGANTIKSYVVPGYIDKKVTDVIDTVIQAVDGMSADMLIKVVWLENSSAYNAYKGITPVLERRLIPKDKIEEDEVIREYLNNRLRS